MYISVFDHANATAENLNLFYAAADIAFIRTSIKNDYCIWLLRWFQKILHIQILIEILIEFSFLIQS